MHGNDAAEILADDFVFLLVDARLVLVLNPGVVKLGTITGPAGLKSSKKVSITIGDKKGQREPTWSSWQVTFESQSGIIV